MNVSFLFELKMYPLFLDQLMVLLANLPADLLPFNP